MEEFLKLLDSIQCNVITTTDKKGATHLKAEITEESKQALISFVKSLLVVEDKKSKKK